MVGVTGVVVGVLFAALALSPIFVVWSLSNPFGRLG